MALPLGLAVPTAAAALLWWTGRFVAATAIAGAVSLVVGFLLGIILLRTVLSSGYGVIGVARTVVEEAVGTRVPLILLMLASSALSIVSILWVMRRARRIA